MDQQKRAIIQEKGDTVRKKYLADFLIKIGFPESGLIQFDAFNGLTKVDKNSKRSKTHTKNASQNSESPNLRKVDRHTSDF